MAAEGGALDRARKTEPNSHAIGEGLSPAVEAMVEGSPPSRSPSPRARFRQLHALLAPIVLAPLLLTACTGVAYRILRDWLGWERDRAHGLMTLHEGEWLKPLVGSHGETLYVLLNGLGLLWMLGTGSTLLWQRLRRGIGARDGKDR
jgi:hypothetical protein